MTTAPASGLPVVVETAVLSVPGVRSVYRAGSLVANLVGEGAVAVGIRQATDPVVSVEMGDEGARVIASLGIDDSTPARTVLRASREAIEVALGAEGVRAAEIVLTIAYVHPRESL